MFIHVTELSLFAHKHIKTQNNTDNNREKPQTTVMHTDTKFKLLLVVLGHRFLFFI